MVQSTLKAEYDARLAQLQNRVERLRVDIEKHMRLIQIAEQRRLHRLAGIALSVAELAGDIETTIAELKLRELSVNDDRSTEFEN